MVDIGAGKPDAQEGAKASKEPVVEEKAPEGEDPITEEVRAVQLLLEVANRKLEETNEEKAYLQADLDKCREQIERAAADKSLEQDNERLRAENAELKLKLAAVT